MLHTRTQIRQRPLTNAFFFKDADDVSNDVGIVSSALFSHSC